MKQTNVSVRMSWISFGALQKNKTWCLLASRWCWNRTRPWHASEFVSFLVRLWTYQHPGTDQDTCYTKSKHTVLPEINVHRRLHSEQLNAHLSLWLHDDKSAPPIIVQLTCLCPARSTSGWCLADWAREQRSRAGVQFLKPTTEGKTLASASLFLGSGEMPAICYNCKSLSCDH